MDNHKNEYKPHEIEKKWQKYWGEHRVYSPNLDTAAKPFYNLMMFPYPSAEGLHVGNMYAFTGADVYGRFQRMKGYDVFEPIGLDGFGIHSENYALKIGKNPMDQSKISQENFYRQLRLTGNAYDWTRAVETYDPNYYKWTQYIFVQMFKNGLAVRKKAAVNFCPSCKTVLSDEQVIDGKCERCGTTAEKRNLEQWFFKITDYAERLLNNLNKLDWSEKVKIAQRNWIGKKEGINIKYKVVNSKYEIECFTTRPDTNFGATFIVLAPEHPLALKLTTRENIKEVERYIDITKNKKDAERIAKGREKSGVFTGSYALNNLNNEKIPVWISDFVLMGFGTGAVVGVPGHDKRDFEFAKKFTLPVRRVVVGKDSDTSEITNIEQVQEEEGKMINSEFLNGLDIHKATKKVMDYLEEKGWGKRETTYHLRDWLISRQRYWGAPIPMVYCETCAKSERSWLTVNKSETHGNGISNLQFPPASPSEAGRAIYNENSKQIKNLKFKIKNSSAWSAEGWYPVPEDQLPVELPYIQDFKPLGADKSPLANHKEFYNVKCPGCGSDAIRETDVSDTFLDSAWYFFRYTSTDIQNKVFDTDRVSRWLPVNMYTGGAEHAVLHLLYSRFMTMFFHDLGLISFEEPYKRFYAHGLLIKEGAKMSKSKGNIIVPDIYINKYGSDTLRMYLMFLGPFDQGGDFYDSGIEGMARFIRRVWSMFTQAIADKHPRGVPQAQHHPGGDMKLEEERLRMMHKTIKKVTEDIENLRYNTAISALMEWYNFLNSEFRIHSPAGGSELTFEEAETFSKLLAPFAPHMTEEIYQNVISSSLSLEGSSLRVEDLRSKSDEGSHFSRDSSAAPQNDNFFNSIHLQPWPTYNEKYLQEDNVIVVIQVNGKRRGEIQVQSSSASRRIKVQSEIEELAKEKIQKYLEGKEIKKVVYVPGKIINFVVV